MVEISERAIGHNKCYDGRKKEYDGGIYFADCKPLNRSKKAVVWRHEVLVLLCVNVGSRMDAVRIVVTYNVQLSLFKRK